MILFGKNGQRKYKNGMLDNYNDEKSFNSHNIKQTLNRIFFSVLKKVRKN